MNILLLASHAVAEYDDVRMFSDLGYDVFCPGGYETPGSAPEGIRPPLPDSPAHPELVARLNETREAYGDAGPLIDAGKARLAPDIIDWADVIIVHHFPEVWILGQWPQIKHKRVIWRTCGQSDPRLEMVMAPLRREGLQIVRYSPAEKRYFDSIGRFAGQDALIRFGKYPDDYGPWIGDLPAVINITQDLKNRGDSCGYDFWQEATRGLARRFPEGPEPPWAIPMGKGSEEIGGTGILTYAEMLGALRSARAYLYTGTTPASYTLGLIEAMLSGVPVVSIGPAAWNGPDLLFEGHEIVGMESDHPDGARAAIEMLLEDRAVAEDKSRLGRQRAIDLFDVDKIGQQWRDFLG